MLDLLLNPFENFFRDNGFMSVLHPEPELFRLADALFVLVGDRRLLTVNGVADVDLIVDNALDL